MQHRLPVTFGAHNDADERCRVGGICGGIHGARNLPAPPSALKASRPGRSGWGKRLPAGRVGLLDPVPVKTLVGLMGFLFLTASGCSGAKPAPVAPDAKHEGAVDSEVAAALRPELTVDEVRLKEALAARVQAEHVVAGPGVHQEVRDVGAEPSPHRFRPGLVPDGLVRHGVHPHHPLPGGQAVGLGAGGAMPERLVQGAADLPSAGADEAGAQADLVAAWVAAEHRDPGLGWAEAEGEKGRMTRTWYGLPGEDVFAAEQERIFEQSWTYVCHESQIPNPGDYYAAKLGREPVLINRRDDGSVGGLLNACAHRGAMLNPTQRGNARMLVCRYHGWSFSGNDGRCLRIKEPDSKTK